MRPSGQAVFTPNFPFQPLQELRPALHAVHVPTVDNLDREQLVRAPLHFIDNAHDRMSEPPADTRLT
jgi:hypothetical protein